MKPLLATEKEKENHSSSFPSSAFPSTYLLPPRRQHQGTSLWPVRLSNSAYKPRKKENKQTNRKKAYSAGIESSLGSGRGLTSIRARKERERTVRLPTVLIEERLARRPSEHGRSKTSPSRGAVRCQKSREAYGNTPWKNSSSVSSKYVSVYLHKYCQE